MALIATLQVPIHQMPEGIQHVARESLGSMFQVRMIIGKGNGNNTGSKGVRVKGAHPNPLTPSPYPTLPYPTLVHTLPYPTLVHTLPYPTLPYGCTQYDLPPYLLEFSGELFLHIGHVIQLGGQGVGGRDGDDLPVELA